MLLGHLDNFFLISFFIKISFIYLTVREREREREQAGGAAGAEREGEASSPLSREPNTELDPKTPGS